MPDCYNSAIRTAQAQAFITEAGTGSIIKVCAGTRPTALAALAGGNTILATLTFPSTFGVATAGIVDITEAGVTQNNALHVSGAPGFLRHYKSDGTTVIADYTGFNLPAVTTGVDIPMTTSTITMQGAI